MARSFGMTEAMSGGSIQAVSHRRQPQIPTTPELRGGRDEGKRSAQDECRGSDDVPRPTSPLTKIAVMRPAQTRHHLHQALMTNASR